MVAEEKCYGSVITSTIVPKGIVFFLHPGEPYVDLEKLHKELQGIWRKRKD